MVNICIKNIQINKCKGYLSVKNIDISPFLNYYFTSCEHFLNAIDLIFSGGEANGYG